VIAAFALAVCFALPAGAVAQEPPIEIDEGVNVDGGKNERFELWPELKWRGSKTITYYNSAGKYRDQVKKAAAAWNKSGANVNWKPTSRAQAKVVIKITPSLASQGLATTNGTSALIEVQEDLLTQFPPKQNSQAITVAILAHEMGHVMGLGHEPRKCATMNANLWSFCSSPKEPWEYRCRPLEPDDVRGGVKAFGGRPKNLPKPFCALGKPPNAVTDFLAAYDSDQSQVLLTWGLPARKPPKDLTIYRGKRNGPCPDAKGNDSNVEFTERAADGRVKDFVSGGGTFCYRAVSRNEYFRPGESVKATVEIVGNGPAADFEFEQTGATQVEFTDFSDDPEGDIDSWNWDFGDGSEGSTQRNPTHTFPATGSYQVTLTVTDQGGNSDSVTKSVLVAAGEPPFADFYYEQTAGTSVDFTDFSFDEDGEITTWDWDFGDGSAGSTDQNPTHVFPDYGTYDVTLAVTDNDGNLVETTMEVEVLEAGAPFADFDYSQLSGTTVEFYDYSFDDDGDVVEWLWDFGDGSAGSTEQEPTHAFPAIGEYEVTLTVTDNESKSASVTYTVFVD
jgi:PKD repeat protein